MLNIEHYLKNQIKDFYKLVEVIPNSNGTHTVKYIGLSYGMDRTPLFSSLSHTLNLTQILRDMAISEILTVRKEKSQLQLDESFLTEEQIEKLDKLRGVQKSFFRNLEILNQCKIEWSNQFKVGDRVNFKGHYGIITYKHQMKSKNTPQEWTVRSNGFEYRYVSGTLLSLNKKEDFIIGDHVQVICAACDFNFFYNETGTVIGYADNYYSIKVKFDEAREFDIGFDQETFYFNPTDLVNINDE